MKKRYIIRNRRQEYGFGGILQAVAPFANLIPIPGLGTAIAGGLSAAGGMMEQGAANKQQEEQMEKQRIKNAQLAATNAQANMVNPYQATFQKGGKVAVAPKLEMLPPNPNAVAYNQFFGPMANQLDMLQMAGEKNKNMKVALAAGLGTNGLNKYIEDPAMLNALGKPIPPTNRQGKRVQSFVNSLSQEQINQIGTKYPKDGSVGDKLKYIKDMNMTPKQLVGALDAWSFKTRNKFPMGGMVPGMAPVELEKNETFLTPGGDQGMVNGPSHEQGGVDMNLPIDTFVWSDKLKTQNGKTFAEVTAPLLKQRAKYLKILNS